VFSLDTKNGALRPIGSLSGGVHDAAGAIVGRRDLVFGGGSPATTARVRVFPAGPPNTNGSLPAPRSDAAAVSVGPTTYIVGGYTGSSPDASVLATKDGSTFTSIASLPVPVRYPAVATSGGKLYVFGGQAITGTQAGRPVDDIQLVDPATHSSRVIAHMPEPLQAAVAINLKGTIYLAGGDTSTAQTTAQGIGNQEAAVRSSGSPRLFTTSTIWALDLAKRTLLAAGRLQVPVSHAGVATARGRAWLIGGESGAGQQAAVQMFTPSLKFGTAGAPGAGSPYFGGKLLIADRGNNRLLLLNTSGQVVWRFPSAASGPDPHGFFFPDDAFFVRHGTAIISNQEENETVQEIAYPSGKVLWIYGHPHHIGSAHGYLHEPDDAYLLKDGQVTVADAENCRVLVINPSHRITHQIGRGSCAHHPPAALATPNGDTPLADGNLLISETVGSWVDEITPSGHVVWSRKLPIAYPSDPQQLGPDRYLLADYTNPGQILEFNRAGKILYRYDVASGAGSLNQPSLVELLPSGAFMTNDDYRHRVVAIDPTTQALVWQYGVTDRPGRSPGRLRIPDGFDLLMPDGSTPTHPVTG
jgi:outer membrane protein assembly factor BamB